MPAGAGVRFVDTDVRAYEPDAGAWAHKPWAHGVLEGLPNKGRVFPRGMHENPPIAVRVSLAGVDADPGEPPAPYRPDNRPGQRAGVLV